MKILSLKLYMLKYLLKLDSKVLYFLVLFACTTLQMIGYRLLEPDSWYYIEGAKNLIEINSYLIDCNNIKINQFPPLYSIYLIPYIYILGYTEIAITIANTILFIISSYLIHKIINFIYSDYKYIISSIFVLFLTKYFHSSASENLLIPLLFLQIYSHLDSNHKLKYIVTSVILFILMLLTKNSSILIIIPLIFYYCFEKINKLKQIDLKKISLYSAILISSFIISKLFSTSEYQSHPFNWGSGNYHYYDYIIHIISDYNRFFRPILFLKYPALFPLIFGIFIFASLIYILIREKNIVLILSIFFGIIIHLFIFSNVWIENALRHRFLFWLQLITLGCFLKYIFFTNRTVFLKFTLFLFIGSTLINYSYKRYFLFKDYKKNDIVLGVTIHNKKIEPFICYNEFLKKKK